MQKFGIIKPMWTPIQGFLFFSFPILWSRLAADQLEEGLAKFGYKYKS